MIRYLFAVMLMACLSTPAPAAYVDDLRLKIDDIDSRIKSMKFRLDTAKPEEREPIIHDIYYLRVDRLNYLEDLARETIENSDKRDRRMREIDNERNDLERKYQDALNAATLLIEPKVEADSLSVIETKRGYGYVTYSIKVNVDNPGLYGNVYVEIKGLRFDGHEVESTTLTSKLEEDSHKTITGSAMVSEQEAEQIRRWEIAKVNFYPKR